MPTLYLTPSSISYLTQFILSVTILGTLAQRLYSRKVRDVQGSLLIGFFAAVTIFIGLLFLESASLSSGRLVVVFLENTVLAIALIFLLQFAYRFPELASHRKQESYLVLGLSLVYAMGEGGYAIIRFIRLQAGQVLFRNNWADYVLLLLLLWVPLVLMRQLIDLACTGRQTWRDKLSALLRPQNPEAGAVRSFALLYLFVAALGVFNILGSYYLLSTSLVSTVISLGILIALFIFSVTYLNYQKEGISFMTKLAGITLTVVLALLGTVGWIVSPAYEMSYHPDLPDHRTLRFTPNDLGGYDIEEIPFTFEPTEGSYYDLGNGPLELHLSEQPLNACSTALNFEFPFYEQTYSELYVCNDGTLSMGQPILYRDYQYRYGTGIPLIMALLTDLYPEISSGGVFVLQNSERLIVTWDHLRGFRQTEAVFTFQLTLYHSGIFVISYNGLPPAGSPLLTYRPNDDPGESVWAIGAVPGGRSGYTPQEATLADLPLRSGPGGVVQDYRLEFRQYLNVLFVPLAWMILAVCAFILICLPLFLYFNLVKPLRNLLTGVKQVNSGQLDVRVPIQYNDEIGDLTGSFNKMAGELCSLVGDLEAHVTARTSELAAANEQLLTEISDRETAQAQVLQRQRELAMLEERESLGRDLHDDLGQAIASISVQVQAAQTLISAGQDEAAQINLEQVKQLAQDANASIRNYILGLQEPPTSPQNLVVALRASLRVFSENTGLQCSLNLPSDNTFPAFPPAVEEQILRIIQEALTNIRKHAAAHKVEILFSWDARQVQIVISDDGIGFDLASQRMSESAKKRFGLSVMQERAEMAGGRLEIRSASGQGTKILIFIPRLSGSTPEEENIKSIHGMRILLVDDSPIFLEGLKNLLMARGLTVIGLAHDGLEAQEKVRLLRPDVVVMDLNMPKCSGLEATRLIKAEFPETKIVILTVSEEEHDLFEAIKGGASGYLLKTLDANGFCSLLAGLARDQAPLTPGLATRLLKRFASSSTSDTVELASDDELTARQSQILELVANGMAYKEVAVTLQLSEATIKYHMGQILKRLHLEKRAQAVAYAKRAGLKK